MASKLPRIPREVTESVRRPVLDPKGVHIEGTVFVEVQWRDVRSQS
jgi:hypothetical protein